MFELTVESVLRSSIEAAADILRAFGAKEVYVFGSAVHGSLREDSDVDLRVSGLPPAVFFRAASKAADALGRPIWSASMTNLPP
jgi:predicted nucleotidyltransferase